MAVPNATYSYTYGSESQHNRQIRFFRFGAPGTIQAQVHVLDGTIPGNIISTIPSDKISVEMMSTSQKAAAYVSQSSRKLLSEFTISQQDAILYSLKPDGRRKIHTVQNPGMTYEQVISMNIYDVSC